MRTIEDDLKWAAVFWRKPRKRRRHIERQLNRGIYGMSVGTMKKTK